MPESEPVIPTLPEERIPVGISSCLLGEEVRYDGGHKRDPYINGTLSRYFELVPVCPEVAIGLGIPREPIRLVRARGETGVRVVGVRSPDLDVGDELAALGRAKAAELTGIHGYLLKRGSPSCGMERVKVYTPEGNPAGADGRGAYAAALMAARPELPVEEEGRLGDPGLRESFLQRVFAHYRWRALEGAGLTPRGLVAFHRRHKLLVMAHSPRALTELGRMVAQSDRDNLRDTGAAYLRKMMATLAVPATRKGHTNVLHHLMGYLKNRIDSADKAELLEVIELFRTGSLPLAAPLTLLGHHFRRHPHSYVADQLYLRPLPAELLPRDRL